MLQFVLVVAIAIPAVVALIKVRSVGDQWIDETLSRISKRPDVARRSLHYRPLWKTGILCCLLALMPLIVGLKGNLGSTNHTTGSQWLVLALISIALLGFGAVLLACWWLLAGRRQPVAAGD